ncbi:MAG: PKD domain-containing protein [Gemmatimonadota bacterium]|nr:MAG: PKD domain-containing protein [Gemmatimonadota bacterium]
MISWRTQPSNWSPVLAIALALAASSACEDPADPEALQDPRSAEAVASGVSDESPYIYGIHDHDPNPQEFLDHLGAGGVSGWITATIAIGSNPNDTGGDDFSRWADQGHTVIVRLNNGYCGEGTIPPPAKYDDFARRAANYVAASRGAHIWVIGNETNLAHEWPPVNGHKRYVSPQDYALLFRKTYDAIKAVRPDDKVVPQALAPFGGPYGLGNACGYSHDGNPLSWVNYMNQMLAAIRDSGGMDGIAVHINSRGYTRDAIHSGHQVNVAGQNLYTSFYVYKDWVDFGIPPDLYHLPLYATESNGIYYWSGGHPESPASHYEPGWVQEIYAEIDRYNGQAATTGKPIFRAVNLYRWCAWCDGWNIDDSPYKGQILADLDQAVAQGYRWPDSGEPPPPEPGDDNVALGATEWSASSVFNSAYGGDKAIDGQVSEASKWTSDGRSGESWLALDLGQEYDVTAFRVQHAGAAGEWQAFNTQAYRLERGASLSGPWTTLIVVDNQGQEDLTTTTLSTPTTLRWVRLYVTDTGVDDYARIPEFEVYGTPREDDAETLTNGDFAAGLQGWSTWVERGSLAPQVSSGALRLVSRDYNGGVYQQFRTGGADATVTIDGFWASDPTVANAAWAEVLVINGPRAPRDGEDINGGQADVVLIYKNDTWASPGGWSGRMSASSPVAGTGSFVAADSVATLILKAGSVVNSDAGVRFDDIELATNATPPANSAPIAVASADPTAGTAPLSVTFDGGDSSDPDGDPLTYTWEFGDGTGSVGATVTHVYDAAGDYTAVLTVDDGKGGSDMASVAISVTAAPPPTGVPIENGGFETGGGSAGAAAGWTFFSSPGYGATLDLVGDPVHGGARSQELQTPQPTVNDRFAGVYQVASTTPGTKYTVSAWSRTHFPGGHAWDHIARLGIDITGGTDFAAPSVEWYEFDSRKDAWHRVELDVITSGPQVTLFLQSWRKWAAGGGSLAWFDDVEMVAGGTQPPPQGGVPLAVAAAQPLTGPAPLTVAFDGTGSSDPDGDPLTYSWDFGDGAFDSGSQSTHIYDLAGSYQASLTVDDGKDGSDTATLTINVTRPTIVMPDYCPPALDFAAIRQQLVGQGKQMATVKIGFHVGPGGNAQGLGEWMRCLDAAGIPFFLKSADAAGPIWEAAQLKAASGVPHVLIYRRSVGTGWNFDVPDYNAPPAEEAARHWQRHIDEFPPELEPYKHLIWLESINEVDKNRSEWLAEFAYHTAQIALQQGFNWAAYGWSAGEPEREHWTGPWMQQFLRLAAEHPDRIGVALHEYSYVRDNLDRLYPNLVGRFQMLYDVADSLGIARPTVVITEFGWVYDDVAPLEQAMTVDLPWAAELYAAHPEVLGAAIWYLGPGFGGIANQAQKLIAPLTEYALQTYFVVP